jgi:hypothetical protein
MAQLGFRLQTSDLHNAQLQESSRNAGSCRIWRKPWCLCWRHSTEAALVGSENSSDHPIWNRCIPEWRQHSAIQIYCRKPARMGGNNTQTLTWASEPMLLHRWSSRLRRASDTGKFISSSVQKKNAVLVNANHFNFEYCIYMEHLNASIVWPCELAVVGKMPFAASRFRVLHSSLAKGFWWAIPIPYPSIHKSMHGTLFSWNFHGMGPGEIVPMYRVWLNFTMKVRIFLALSRKDACLFWTKNMCVGVTLSWSDLRLPHE